MSKLKCIFKMTALCICLMMFMTRAPVMVSAEGCVVSAEPRMTYILSYNAVLQISSTGQATITGSVRGKNGVTSTYVKVILQKYVSGDWEDVEDWEVSENGRSASVNEMYQVSRGTYRVYMTCRANTETKTSTSLERTY